MPVKKGKIVVITGATRGLGRALVARFVADGHTVLGCGRTVRAVEELRQTFPRGHDFAAVDVACVHQVNRWAQQLIQRWGAPDLLLNNASLINRNAPLWMVPESEFSAVIDVNIKGMVNTIRAFVPAMIEQQSGVIVNFSSGWGRKTAPEVAPYCATKWAIEGLTQAFAQELPEGMAAISVNPGLIDTAMLRSCLPEEAVSSPSPEQWAQRAVPFLLRLGPQHNGQQLTAP